MIVVAIIGSGGVGALVPWLLAKLDHRPSPQVEELRRELEEERRRADVFETALKALLFDKIARLHEETVEKGLPVGVDVKRRADVAYTAYAALGGNGVGRHLYEELIEAHASTGPGTVPG